MYNKPGLGRELQCPSLAVYVGGGAGGLPSSGAKELNLIRTSYSRQGLQGDHMWSTLTLITYNLKTLLRHI